MPLSDEVFMKTAIRRLITVISTVIGITLLSTGCHSGFESKMANREPAVLRGTLLIDPDFSADERAAIEAGLNMWLKALNGSLDVDVADETMGALREAVYEMRLATHERIEKGLPPDEDGMARGPFWSRENGCVPKLLIIRTTSVSEDVMELEGGSGGKLLGLANPNCVRKFILIVADRMSSSAMLTRVTAHELGHMWGLWHNFKHGVSIMYPYEGVNTAPCITKADTADFCARWKCDARKMTPKSCEKR
jgi:hypothetical protein